MTETRMLRTMRWPLVALLLTGLTLPVQAQQNPDSPVARRKRIANNTNAWLGQNGLARTADEFDRAAAVLNLSKLEVETYNYGPLTGDTFGSSFRFANKAGSSRYYIWASNFAIAVKEGAWHPNALVHESYTHDWSKYDWDAKDGSSGDLFSDPPQYLYSFPMMAVSDLPATWPASGWPAPDVETTWWGTETWGKWDLVGDRNVYGEFDDTYADREQDGQSTSLGISVRMRAIGYSSINVIYFQYEVTNNSSYTYDGVYLGLMVDSGGPTTSDYIGYLDYDESRQLVYCKAYNYDPATGTHQRDSGEELGFVGHMFLESPTGSLKTDGTGAYVDNPADVLTRVALLSWNDYIDPAVDGEDQLYGAMSGDVSYMNVGKSQLVWKTDVAGNNPVYKQTASDFIDEYGDEEDPFFYVSSGPITLGPSESVDFVVAAVAGYNEAGMQVEADKAIQTYNAKFNAPAPPPAPQDFQANGVLAGPHGKVFDPVLHDYQVYYTPTGDITLTWDASKSVATPDPNSGDFDFEGIRIYRSEDRGDTWGQPRYDSQGGPVGFYPIAQWDLDNTFKDNDLLSGTYLGSDTGLVGSCTDPNTVDGFEYWYAITAYDHGAFIGSVQTVASLESSLLNDPAYPSVLAVIAGAKPSGYTTGMVGTGTDAGATYSVYVPDEPDYQASVIVEVFNDALITGDSYSITLSDYYLDALGDTVRANVLTPIYGDEYPVAGVTLTNTSTAQVLYEKRQSSAETFDLENLPISQGFRLVTQDVNGGQPGVYDFYQVEVPDSSGWNLYTSLTPWPSGSLERVIAHEAYWDFDVIWRQTDSGGDQNHAISRYDQMVVDVPFEVYRSDTGQRLWPMVQDDYGSSPDWDNGWERILITPIPYADDFFDPVLYPEHDPAHPTYWSGGSGYEADPYNRRGDWLYYFDLDQWDPDTWYEDETWHASIYKPVAALLGETMAFSTTAAAIDQSASSLDDIKVVPNPYYIFEQWDQSVNRRKIQFINVPPNTTIDIYTLSGELIASLAHDASFNSSQIGVVDWNIWTYEYTETAYGLFLFVAKTADGQTKVGKFAIIR
jgi:hypothetical protein